MAGLSLFVALVLAAALVAWVVLRDGRYVAAPAPAPSAATVDPAGAGRALALLEAAVEDRDPSAAAALAPRGSEASDLLRAVVENAAALQVEDFTLRYVTESGPPAQDGTWTATVDTTWGFGGFDDDPAASEISFAFRAEGEDVRVVSVGGGEHRTPLWLSGPLDVRRTNTTLVLAPEGAVGRYAALADAAVPVVQRVLPSWRPRLVVEVPPSEAALHEALDAEPGTYDDIAAVTASVDGALAPDAPVHVLVNPDELGRLRPVGAQVVMSHEAVHVATDAPSSSTPLWLLEGFADYVALRDVRLPVTTTAAQAIREVRRNGLPRELPSPDDFETGRPHLGAVYESAWLVCTVLADRAGERALVETYQAVDTGVPVPQALERHAGLTQAELVRAWRARLQDLAA